MIKCIKCRKPFTGIEDKEDTCPECLKIIMRLEYLRGEIKKECISTAEIAELQSLAEHIEPGDTVLLEWAGVHEFEEYYYINFKDREIQSWNDERSDLDKHNKAIGNSFKSFIEARDFLTELLKNNSLNK